MATAENNATFTLDINAVETTTYTLGGTDAAAFNVNAATGVITFASNPDFESPADASYNFV